jgi:hypothetical protein
MTDNKKYLAFSIDTSVFERYGCKIESGLFESLSQFKKSSIKIIVTDLVHNELKKHISIKIKDAIEKLKTGINKGNNHLLIIKDDLIKLRNTISDIDSVDQIAENRIKEFYEKIGAEMIYSSDYVDLSDLLDLYFNAKPPFSQSGDKKAEFPDAIALNTLDGWAKNKDKNVIVISTDHGWRDYCNDNDRLLWMDDLKNAIIYFQPKIYVVIFRKFIKSIGIENFSEFLDNILVKALIINKDDSDVDIEAHSYHEYEYDDVEIEYLGYEYLGWPNDDIMIDIISIEAEKVVLQLNVNVLCEVSASFSFSIYDSIDKDYVNLGNNYYTINTQYERTVIVELSGPYSENNLSKIKLISIDIPSNQIYLDFGEIEIEDSDDYYEE